MIDALLRNIDPQVAYRALCAERCERSLYAYLEAAWPAFDPSPFVGGWHLEAIAEHLEAVTNGEIRRLLVNVPPRSSKTSATVIAWPTWTWALRPMHGNPLRGPGVRFLCASYGARKAQEDGVTARRLIASEWYRNLWGHRVQISPHRDNAERYDTLAGGSRISTGIPESLGKGGIVRILDDIHKTNEVESEDVREGVIRAYREIWSTRSNDPEAGVEVLIMQRQHERDLSGYWLESDEDVVHLCIPAEWEGKSGRTMLGWRDPRTEIGESYWPARFPPAEIARKQREIGPYAWCNPGEAPVLMADLSMRRIDRIAEGDRVIGFSEPSESVCGSWKTRSRLVVATVKSISRSVRQVVKVTLDTGKVIRCTPDHKWYCGKRRGIDRKLYLPARVGKFLYRVCEPEIPVLTDPHMIRAAGWLAGFFDGEGSVSVQQRPGYTHSSQIVFTQGAGRNLSLCDKLEETLTLLGFEFGYDERIRTDRTHKENAHFMRHYHINGHRKHGTLPIVQRFLHVVGPAKWRDRLAESALVSKFQVGREKVVSIEPDGEETVYGLETTTGNYVVWGFASSNSGQFQQRPEPRGGGIIRSDWWQVWPPEGEEDAWTQTATDEDGRTRSILMYPEWDLVVVSVDGAYTEKEENDWCACTVWGVFQHRRAPRIMLMDAWRERLELHAFVRRIIETCERRGADALLIEAKGPGLSAIQEVKRLARKGEWQVHGIDPGRADKAARLHSVVPLFADAVIFAPERRWARMVIDEVATAPKGRWDDLADTASQALNWMRRNGLARLGEEATQDDYEANLFRGKSLERNGAREHYGV